MKNRAFIIIVLLHKLNYSFSAISFLFFCELCAQCMKIVNFIRHHHPVLSKGNLKTSRTLFGYLFIHQREILKLVDFYADTVYTVKMRTVSKKIAA